MSSESSSESPACRLRLDQLSEAELRQQLARWSEPLQQPAPELPLVIVEGADGQHGALMMLDHYVQLRVEGPLGDYAFSFHRSADALVQGNVGDAVADGMRSGAVRVRGNAGHAAGVAMVGGTVAIYGAAGDRCGAAMSGGELFIRGDAGDYVGAGAVNGTIVIGGDAGEGIGQAMVGATIFIRGQAASVGNGAVEGPLRERERLRLGLLLINASIRGDAKEFRRVVPTAVWQAEQNRPRGEVRPSWR